MMTGVFWASVALLFYTYVAFPIVTLLRAMIAPRTHRAAAITPSVSLVIAARNEAGSIARKLENIDQLDYPAQRLQVIVASDGSEDATEAIVQAHDGRPIELLRRPREGKAAALNAAVAAATGEILVFSDTNSRYEPAALHNLVAPFADPNVGGVAGNQVYERARSAEASTDGERTYWGFDRLLKGAESRSGSTISATGAIYAIRRELFDPIPPGVTDDFFTSVGVIAKGRRLVFAPDAIAYERPAATGRLEFQRKVRIMTRGLRAIVMRRALLDPRRHGFYAIQLLSHKLLRRLMSIPLVLLAASSVSLWGRGALYRAAAIGQIAFYAAALVGLLPWRLSKHRLFSIPAFFCSATLASAMATWNVLRGRSIERWEPARGDDES
jgi:cellulose synthase/poly-beta-1,6-N-acetylglucosamine synthase-like glycosyltransferase